MTTLSTTGVISFADFRSQLLDLKSQIATLTSQLQSSSSTNLYSFSTFTFQNCGATGTTGPTLSQCLSAYTSTSWASSSKYFNVNPQGIQLWTVPATGSYTITAAGAAGGGYNAGKGRIISATVQLTIYTSIKILVGQSGNVFAAQNSTGGGGGATFICNYTNSPILVAPGGGGGANTVYSYDTSAGQFAQGTDTPGTSANNSSGGASLTNNSNVQKLSTGGTYAAYGAISFANGGTGGATNRSGGEGGGGFGGGGATTSQDGAGGGGYQGGAAIATYSGGGGYSYYASPFFLTTSVTDQGLNAGQGYVTITAKF